MAAGDLTPEQEARRRLYVVSDWASSHGVGDIESRVGMGLPLTDAEWQLLESISSVPPEAGAPAVWNDFVARVEDNESGSSDLLPGLVVTLLTGGQGGATFGQLVTGGNVGAGAAIDAGALGAGAVIAGSGVIAGSAVGTAAAAGAGASASAAATTAATTQAAATASTEATLASSVATFTSSLQSITGPIHDFVSSASGIVSDIVGPVGDAIHSINGIVQEINDGLIKPIVGPIQSIVANYSALTDVLHRDLGAGLSGILKIPGDIANALTSVDASFARAMDMLGQANSSIVRQILVPALMGASGHALGDLHPLFQSALAPATGKFSPPPQIALGESPNLEPFKQWVEEQQKLLADESSLPALFFSTLFKVVGVLEGLAAQREPYVELWREEIARNFPTKKIDPATVIALYQRGELSHTDAMNEMRVQGYSESRALALLASQQALPDTARVLSLFSRRWLDNVEAKKALEAHGWTDDDIDTLLNSSYTELGAEALLELVRRGELKPEEAQVALERQGYRQADAQLAVSTAYHLLGLQDIVQLHDRAQIASSGQGFAALSAKAPQSFLDYASEVGVNEANAQVLWSNHWQLLSPALACQAFFRGYINRTQLGQSLAAASLPVELHDNYIDLQRPQLPARMIVSMLGKGAISGSDAMTYLERLGFDQVNANLLVRANEAAKKPTHAAVADTLHGLTQQTVLQLYDAGTIDRGHAVGMLGSLGWGHDAIEATLSLHDVRAAHTERLAEIAVIVSNVKAGTLDLNGAQAELGKLNLTNAELAKALAQVNTARTLQAKLPSEAQLIKMHKDGIISEAEAMTTLQLMGYSELWAGRLIQLEAFSGKTKAAPSGAAGATSQGG